jgi:hypothetical protein
VFLKKTRLIEFEFSCVKASTAWVKTRPTEKLIKSIFLNHDLHKTKKTMMGNMSSSSPLLRHVLVRKNEKA